MRNNQGRKGARPIIRFRSLVFGAIGIAVMIAGPLLMVWKQVYLTSASLKIDKLTDSIAVVTKEIATLRLKCEQLSSKERIEHIAQTALGLGYPSADRIVIVKVPRNAPVAESDWSNDLVAFFKKTFWGNRG